MADVTINAAALAPTGTTQTAQGTCAAAISQGQPVYMDATSGNLLKPCANGAIASAQAVGIALNAAQPGQPVSYAIGGDLTFGSGLTRGTVYCISANSGKIAPVADLVTGNYVTVLGVATGAGTLRMGLIISAQAI